MFIMYRKIQKIFVLVNEYLKVLGFKMQRKIVIVELDFFVKFFGVGVIGVRELMMERCFVK